MKNEWNIRNYERKVAQKTEEFIEVRLNLQVDLIITYSHEYS